MQKPANERRHTIRRDIRTRVRLRNGDTNSYENAHLLNLGRWGLYLMARRKLNIGQEIEIVAPSEVDEDRIKIQAQVIRQGHHRWWGLFSYGCRILSTS